MNQLRALIIDDEPLAHKVILQYADDVPFLKVVGQAFKATDAYTMLQQHPVDLLFLDINMPKLKGLDFLRTLQTPPAVIITSAYEEYALESFELQVCDYLLKPFRFERFLRAVHHAQQQIKQASGRGVNQVVKTEATKMFLKVDKKQVQIEILDIVHLESYGNYVKVWLADQCLLTPRTLSSFENELPSDFARIHKSFIIQKACVSYVEGNQVMMSNGQLLPIGKNHRSSVKEWF